MPTYEYECTKCAQVFEEEASITAPPRQRCPRCRGKVRRLISGGTGILFKGSGFYVTDSRRSSSAPASPAGEAGAATPPSPGETAGAAPTDASAANDSKTAAADKP